MRVALRVAIVATMRCHSAQVGFGRHSAQFGSDSKLLGGSQAPATYESSPIAYSLYQSRHRPQIRRGVIQMVGTRLFGGGPPPSGGQ